MDDTKYNGWTNYPTWNYNLWMSNDEASYNYWNERARYVIHNLKPQYPSQKPQDTARNMLADELKESIEDYIDQQVERDALMARDLAFWAVHQINFEEIADSWLEDLIPEDNHADPR